MREVMNPRLRKVFGAGVALLVLILPLCLQPAVTALQANSNHTSQVVQKRLRWQEFVEDPVRLESFRRGIEKMRSRNTARTDSADYRRSLEYWAAIHSYFGPVSNYGVIADWRDSLPKDLQQFFLGLSDLTPPASPANLASKIWDNCEHGTEQFFGWHRIYLYYFERVLSEAAGDPNLRLPYWDYTDPAQIRIPAEFASAKSGAHQNALFDNRRTSQTLQLDPNDTDVDQALVSANFGTFSSTIEGGVHGAVHCAVGNGCRTPLMGMVPAAAHDPLFWLHHTNLDRLAECWIARNGPLPTALQNQSYSFVDEKGTEVTRKVGEFFDSKQPLDYSYDNTTQCSRKPLPPAMTLTLAAQTKPVTLSATPLLRVRGNTSVDISAPVGELKQALSATLAGGNTSSAIELSLQNVQVQRNPGGLLRVFVARANQPNQRVRVGTIAFFGIGGHKSHMSRNYRLDITQAMRSIGISDSAIRVTFEPGSGTVETQLAGQPQFDDSANVTIEAIELRIVPVVR